MATHDRVQSDPRIVSGARCVWWGTIGEVGQHDSGLPCCPHCGGVLFEADSIDAWWAGVDEHERRGNVGYRAMIEWIRGKHWRTWPEAVEAWQNHQATTPMPHAASAPELPAARQRLRAAILESLVELNSTVGPLIARPDAMELLHRAIAQKLGGVAVGMRKSQGRILVEALGITEVV